MLAYAWNPLLAIEVAGSGHIDILGALLLVVSAVAACCGVACVAAVALALGRCSKVPSDCVVPLYWRRVRLRDAAIAAYRFGLLYLPFLEQGRIPMGSLGTYMRSFRFNDPVFRGA